MSEPARALPGNESEELATLGRELARGLLLCIRARRSHGATNQIFAAAVRALQQTINEAVRRCGWLELRSLEGLLYLGEQRLRLPRSDGTLVTALLRELRDRGVGSISVRRTVAEEDLLPFLEAFDRTRHGGIGCFQRLSAELRQSQSPFLLGPPETVDPTRMPGREARTAARGPMPPFWEHAAAEARAPRVAGVSRTAGADGALGGSEATAVPGRAEGTGAAGGQGLVLVDASGAERRVPTSPGPPRPEAVAFSLDATLHRATARSCSSHSMRGRCRQAFATALAAHRVHYLGAIDGQPEPLTSSKRTAQSLVDLMLEDEASLLGLTTLKTGDAYTFFHAVNVCLLAIGLGRRIGLSRVELAELGLAGLLHDLGKIALPEAIRHKREPLTAGERAQADRHPVLGVRALLRFWGLNPWLYPSMIGSFEHHLSFDGDSGGFPATDPPRRPHLIGGIIAVADAYDSLTTPGPDSNGRRREQVLSGMLERAGTIFDPRLVRLLIGMLGMPPLGSVVLLRSGRRGIVVGAPEDGQAPDRCRLRLLDEQNQTREELDLSRVPAEGLHGDAILGALDPSEVEVDLRSVFLD